jgi:hypothetical protein
VDSQGRNLIALYDTVEITVEPEPDSSPNPTDQVAYRSSLPPEGLAHARHLLVAFGSTPNNLGLVHGLLQETTKLDQLAHDLLSAQEAGQPAEVRKNAERMMNLLVGSQSPDYKDWDQDGNLEDVGDGFGLLLNGDNIGYIEGTFSHASYAATANNATEDMIMHGLHVEVCTQNMEEWAPLLRNVLLEILSGDAGPGAEPQVRQAVALADELLEGTDLNGNEQVEPVPGEGGAHTDYQHAYYMVDIELYDENK